MKTEPDNEPTDTDLVEQELSPDARAFIATLADIVARIIGTEANDSLSTTACGTPHAGEE